MTPGKCLIAQIFQSKFINLDKINCQDLVVSMQKLYSSSHVTLLDFSQRSTLSLKAGLVSNKVEASAGTSVLKNMKAALGNYVSVSLISYQSGQFIQIIIHNRIQRHLDRLDTLEFFLKQGILMNIRVFRKEPIWFWLSRFLYLSIFGFTRIF